MKKGTSIASSFSPMDFSCAVLSVRVKVVMSWGNAIAKTKSAATGTHVLRFTYVKPCIPTTLRGRAVSDYVILSRSGSKSCKALSRCAAKTFSRRIRPPRGRCKAGAPVKEEGRNQLTRPLPKQKKRITIKKCKGTKITYV